MHATSLAYCRPESTRHASCPLSRPPLSVYDRSCSTHTYKIPGLCPCGTVVLLRPLTTTQTSTHTSRSHLQATTDTSAIAHTTGPNQHWIPPATGLGIRRRSSRRWPCQCHHMVTTLTKVSHSHDRCWAATAAHLGRRPARFQHVATPVPLHERPRSQV